jgi:hypothetical protein
MSSSHRFTASSGQREKNKNNSCNNTIKKRERERIEESAREKKGIYSLADPSSIYPDRR